MYSRTPKRRARPHAHARDRRSTGIQSPPPCDAGRRRGGGGRGARAGASAHGGVVRCGGRAPQRVRALGPRAGASAGVVPGGRRAPPAEGRRRRGMDACARGAPGRPPRSWVDVSTSVDFYDDNSLHVSIVLGFSYGRSMWTHPSPTNNMTTPPPPPRRALDARGRACAVLSPPSTRPDRRTRVPGPPCSPGATPSPALARACAHLPSRGRLGTSHGRPHPVPAPTCAETASLQRGGALGGISSSGVVRWAGSPSAGGALRATPIVHGLAPCASRGRSLIQRVVR